MARSSTEAKYKALALASTKALWLQSLLTELKVEIAYTHVLLCDNNSAKHLTSNYHTYLHESY